MLENVSYFSTDSCSISPIMPLDRNTLVMECAKLYKDWFDKLNSEDPLDDYIESLDDCIEERGIVILSRVKDRSVGFRYAERWFPKSESHLYLAAAYVVPEFRRNGIYGTMIDLTELVARQQGFSTASSHTTIDGDSLSVLLKKDYLELPESDIRHSSLGNVFKRL